jgi:hypothetical protein
LESRQDKSKLAVDGPAAVSEKSQWVAVFQGQASGANRAAA